MDLKGVGVLLAFWCFLVVDCTVNADEYEQDALPAILFDEDSDCSCGPHSISCEKTEDSEIKCECKENFEQIGVVCEAKCDVCGPHSTGCDATEDSEIKCECKENFEQIGVACKAKCDVCGPHSLSCKGTEDSEIKCECKENFAQIGVVCKAKCDVCGPHSTGCDATEDSEIKCECKENFAQIGVVCEAKCDVCGPHSLSCKGTVDSEIKCECKENFEQIGVACKAKCDVCGPHSISCEGAEDSTIKCNCKENFEQIGVKCEAKCEVCGPYAISCEGTDDSTIQCNCKPKFVQMGNKCVVNCDDSENTCENEGKCVINDEHRSCECNPGTSGDLCEKVDTCETNASFCGKKTDVECVYDVKTQNATCKCTDGGKYFDSLGVICRKPCSNDSDCKNKASCLSDPREENNLFCRCHDGTMGDICGIVRDCVNGVVHCGESSSCIWDEKEGAKCICNDPTFFFDNEDKSCIDCECGKESSGCNITKNVKTCFCNEGFKQNGKICEPCDCGSYGECSFKSGKQVCDCEAGYENNDGTCEECDCGNNGTCTFVNKIKVCSCDTGYGYDGEKCVECHCGDEGISCTITTGNKTCVCNSGFAQNGDKCESCDCGVEGKCYFNNGEKFCRCNPKYGVKNGTCVACNCGDKASGCMFNEDKELCLCITGYSPKDNVCTACDCGENGRCYFDVEGSAACECNKGFEPRNGKCYECDCGEDGTCSFDDRGNPVCECEPGSDLRDGKCHQMCEDESCLNGGTCNGTETRFCECLPGTAGDFCDDVTDCEGSLKECKGDNGECRYDVENQTAICHCPEGKQYQSSSHQCKKTCSKDTKCENGGSCINEFCHCPDGISGDLCDIVEACKTLEETCRKANARCLYDSKLKNAACVCIDDKYMFDKDQQICKPKWCEENPCGAKSKCKFENGVGFCECDNLKMYYNYEEGKCKEIDACLLMSPCKENEICQKGKCACIPNYVNKDGKCIPKLCQLNPCFPGASCVETELTGKVKCVCDNKNFYNGKRCLDGSCFLPGYRINCTEKCSAGFSKNDDGECVPTDETKRCEKNCNYGTCVKQGDKEVCKCIPRFAKLVNDTCILDASVVCASQKLADDSLKCDCSGSFKYAENGITCEKKSCSDEDVQKECLKAAASECKDHWKSTESYECSCGEGYSKNKKGYCTENCELDKKIECMESGRSCFINEMRKAECVCPPSLLWNEKTKKCDKLDENVFMLQNLPALKKKYLRKDESVDIVLLNTHIISSVKQIFRKLQYSYLFHYIDSGDILNCSIVIKFSENGKSEIKRFTTQKITNLNCTGCDENVALLPPSLYLRSGSDIEVKDVQLDLCSKPITNLLCGKHADCKEKRCFCPPGFRISDYSVQKNADFTILRCEDVDECVEGPHTCSEETNTTCVNDFGDYYCKCLPGFKKVSDELPYKYEENKEPCVDFCSPNPCKKGTCDLKEKVFDCRCDLGYTGSLCDREDNTLKKANINIKILGAVLGTLLGITLIIFIAYVWRKKKNSYSEDFTPAPRYADTSEMKERRPMRGVSNNAYE